MAAEGTQLKGNVGIWLDQCKKRGELFDEDQRHGRIQIATGTTLQKPGQTTATVPLVTPGGGLQTLFPDVDVPSGWRFKATQITIGAGATGWSQGVGLGLSIQDNVGQVLLYVPTNALQAYAQLAFGPNNQVFYGQQITASSSTATVTTFPASTFVTTTLQGQPVRIVSGTGALQRRMIASNTATTLTVTSAWTVTPDATSVFEFPFQTASAGSTTTLTAATGTPYTAGGLIGKTGVAVSGTAGNLGIASNVLSNSTSVITLSNTITSIAAGDAWIFTNNPEMNGAIDYNITGKLAGDLASGSGLYALPVGTIAAGSALNVYVEGYYSPS